MSRLEPHPDPVGPAPSPVAAEPSASPLSPPVLRTVDLFKAHREILIEHNSQWYRLRLTSLDRLILTK